MNEINMRRFFVVMILKVLLVLLIVTTIWFICEIYFRLNFSEESVFLTFALLGSVFSVCVSKYQEGIEGKIFLSAQFFVVFFFALYWTRMINLFLLEIKHLITNGTFIFFGG